MEGTQFDSLLRGLATSRRGYLGGVLALACGWREPATGEAKRKRKKRRPRKAKPNAFGCLGIGQPCKNASKCCSGLCTGKKGKRKCAAHGTGTCNQDGSDYCAVGSVALCNGSPTCVCAGATAGSSYCGSVTPPSGCAACTKDADCEALGFPAGSACVLWASGPCAGLCESGTACLAPCGARAPQPVP